MEIRSDHPRGVRWHDGATSVLGLLGVESDPLTGREHILLATILERAWRSGRPMDLEMDALQRELGQAVEELKSALDPMNVELSTTTLKPRRTEIDIRFVALTWAPYRDDESAW